MDGGSSPNNGDADKSNPLAQARAARAASQTADTAAERTGDPAKILWDPGSRSVARLLTSDRSRARPDLQTDSGAPVCGHNRPAAATAAATPLAANTGPTRPTKKRGGGKGKRTGKQTSSAGPAETAQPPPAPNGGPTFAASSTTATFGRQTMAMLLPVTMAALGHK